MKVYVYCLYNLYLNCADNPQFSPIPPKDTIEGYRRQIMQDPDTAHKYHTQEKELRFLGMFDDMTGTFELNESVQRLCELRQFFPKDYLEKKSFQKKALEDAAFKKYMETQENVLDDKYRDNDA